MQEKDLDSYKAKTKRMSLYRSAIPNGTYINEGDKVEYEIEESERGPRATKIKKL